jgi:uncharacterized membrane protein
MSEDRGFNPSGMGGQEPAWGSQPPAASAGIEPRIANLLSYLFMGLGGLIIYLTQRDREVRFHGAQSVLIAISFLAFWIGLTILQIIFGTIDILGFIAAIIGFIISLVVFFGYFVLVIIMCVKGYNQEHVKLPFIGDIAEQWAAK